MSQFKLFVLGSPLLERDDVPVKLTTRKPLALLIFLAVTGRSHTREYLADLFWPDNGYEGGKKNLRVCLHVLRRSLGSRFPLANRQNVAIAAESSLWVDSTRFNSLLDSCGAHGHDRGAVCPACKESLNEAAALYRGDFLAGFGLKDSAAFDDWQLSQAESLRSEMNSAFSRLIVCFKDAKQWDQAVRHAQRWLEMDRMNEAAHRCLIELYAQSGQRTSAMRQYEECVRILEQELGAEPDSGTKQLLEKIKGGKPISAEPAHQNEWPAHRHNLPIQLTRFIGRETEKREVIELLRGTPLLTLTGSGGCGKTRLALEVASALKDEYEDGVWLVDLAPLNDPDRVPRAVGTIMGLWEQSKASMTEILAANLKYRRLLIVLDNCEHVIAVCAEMVSRLLGECAQLQVLATSREPLKTAGETVWRVPSLTMPEPCPTGDIALSRLLTYEAVGLFMDRATSVSPGYSPTEYDGGVIARICRQLDGMPLAIELAAARMRTLTIQQIQTRLVDRFKLLTKSNRTVLPRHRTLRAAIDWSFESLSAEEQAVLCRLAVFFGGCTLEAAEVVCSDPDDTLTGEHIAKDEVLDLFTNLVDKSLVQAEVGPGDRRYSLLETVREYAVDKLSQSGDEMSVRGKHAEYFTLLAGEADSHVNGNDWPAWFAKLKSEHNNMRSALSWLSDGREPELMLRLAGALYRFWYNFGYLKEGVEWSEKALETSRGAVSVARARVLCYAGHMLTGLDHMARAKRLFDQSLRIYQKEGHSQGEANALFYLAIWERRKGETAQASALFEQSLSLGRQAGDKQVRFFAMTHLGEIAREEGKMDRAKALLSEGQALAKELGQELFDLLFLQNRGRLQLGTGHSEQAMALFEKSLKVYRRREYKQGIAGCLTDMARAALMQKEYNRAQSLLCESLSLYREIGKRRLIAVCLDDFAHLASERGQPKRALRLFAAADALAHAIDQLLESGNLSAHIEGVAAVRTELGQASSDSLWAEGSSMPLEEAIEYALK